MVPPFALLLLGAAPCPDPLAPVDVRVALEEQTISLVRYGAHVARAEAEELPREGEGVEQLIESSQAPLRACYDAALTADPTLQGTWRVRLVVDKEGVSRDVGVTPAPDGYARPKLERCVAAVFSGHRSEWSLAPEPVAFEFALRFAQSRRPPHERKPRVALARPSRPAPPSFVRGLAVLPLPPAHDFLWAERAPFEVVSGDRRTSQDNSRLARCPGERKPAVFKDDLLRAIQSNVGAYRDCFAVGHPGGSATFALSVDPFGRVTGVSTGSAADWVGCVGGALKEVRFEADPLRHPARLRIDLPLRFVPSREPRPFDPREALAAGDADWARVDFVTALSMSPNDPRACDWLEGLTESTEGAAAPQLIRYLRTYPTADAACQRHASNALLRWAGRPHALGKRYGRRQLLRTAERRYLELERLGSDWPGAFDAAWSAADARWELEDLLGAARTYHRAAELAADPKRLFDASKSWFVAAKAADQSDLPSRDTLPELMLAERNFVDRFPDDEDAAGALLDAVTRLTTDAPSWAALEELHRVSEQHRDTRCGRIAAELLAGQRGDGGMLRR